MSSFGVKNILRKDIVAYDIFFNQSEEVVNYLSIKCPHINYKHLPREAIVRSRIVQNSTKKTPDGMRQHLMDFTPNDPVFCREYLCSRNLCLQVHRMFREECTTLYFDIPCGDDFGYFVDNTTMKLIELSKYLTLQMSRPLYKWNTE